MLGVFVYQMTLVPWTLSVRDPVTTSLGGGCSPLGAVYEIKVQGVSHVCGGGDRKCAPQRDVPVSYKASHPSECRLRRNVGRLSLSELFSLSCGASFLMFAIAFQFWEREREQGWATGERPGSAGYRVSRLALYLAIGLFILQTCWSLALYGPGF